MFIGDDGDDQDWQSVVDELAARLDGVADVIDDVRTEAEIDDVETELDDIEATLENEVPADADERADLETRLADLREQNPPRWLPVVREFEARLDDIEDGIDDIESQDDIETLETEFESVQSDLDESAIPEGADEHTELQSRLSDVEAEMPDDHLPAVLDIEDELDDVAADVEDAELEAELDDIQSKLDDLADTIEESEIPDDGEETEELQSRIDDLRSDVEDARGPYPEDIRTEIESIEETLTDGDWTPSGTDEIVTGVEEFLDLAGSEFVDTFEAASESPANLAAALSNVREIVAETDLDPDDARETITTLLDGAETLADTVDAAEEWSDLTVRQQLHRKDFYDVLDPENRKDYPPEWNAIKIYEKQYQDGNSEAVEMILLGFEKFESDFMEENVLDSLRRIAPPEAYEELEGMAEKRNQDAIEILGRIGDERILDSIHEFIDGGDVALQKTTLRAIGAIGSEESTQPVANQLVADNVEVRSTAARALGLIGDTRAIEPLADVLDEDDADEVRASAAWALNTIGTERARNVVAEYTDDTAYIVQMEAEKAVTESAA